MEKIKPLDSELKKDISTELKKVEARPTLNESQIKQSRITTDRKGNIKLLVALMIIFWPAAIYYAVTRNFEHEQLKKNKN